jgi:hypothetical protein
MGKTIQLTMKVDEWAIIEELQESFVLILQEHHIDILTDEDKKRIVEETLEYLKSCRVWEILNNLEP